RAHFQRLIEVDKWYALRVASLSGRDPMSLWPLATTWKQLDEILATPVQVRLHTNELPIQATVTLQRIISEWPLARQQPVLSQKLNQLQALRLRAAMELRELVEDYRRVLESYAGGRAVKAAASSSVPSLRANGKSVIERLEGID